MNIPPRSRPVQSRFDAWQNSPAGTYANEQCRKLVHSLLSGWPRRSRSMLAMGAGGNDIIELLWESGFDVTGQASNPDDLARARAKLGAKAAYTLSAPEHMPFDDCSFDFAFGSMESWQDPVAVLRELDRIVCAGLILVFPNAWSAFALECKLRKKQPLCSVAAPHLCSPRQVNSLIRKALGPKAKLAWASSLTTPTPFWKPGFLCDTLNSARLPIPLGAFAAVRVDFGPLYTGTPLLLRAADPVA